MKLVLILADNGTGNTYIMMEARLDALFKKPEEYTVIERFAVIRYNYSRTSCSISCMMLSSKKMTTCYQVNFDIYCLKQESCIKSFNSC